MSRLAHFRKLMLSSCVAACATLALAAPAAAQSPGVRAGASVDPDQFYFGGHVETAPLVDRLYFRPNAEIGFGDDLTTIALNLEFVYKAAVNDDWSVYGGAGPAINFYSFDDDTFTEGGLNFLFGAETDTGLFFEVKLGAIDSPDLKFGVGYTWR